jgi:hypothetical protein
VEAQDHAHESFIEKSQRRPVGVFSVLLPICRAGGMARTSECERSTLQLYLVQHGAAKSEAEDPQRRLTAEGTLTVERTAE